MLYHQRYVPLFILVSFVFQTFSVTAASLPSNVKQDKKQDQKIDFSVRNLSATEKREIVSTIANHISAPDTQQEELATMLRQLLQDLAVLEGQQNSRDIHLVSKLNYCITTFGEVALAGMLAQNPLLTPEKVTQRQALIKRLVENEELYNSLQTLMMQVKESENEILSLYQEEDPAKAEFLKKLYFGDRLSLLNKSSLAMEAWTRCGNVGTVLSSISIPLTFALTKYVLQYSVYIYLPKGLDDKPLAPKPNFFAIIKDDLQEFNPYTYIRELKNLDENINKDFQILGIEPTNDQLNFNRQVGKTVIGIKAGFNAFIAGYQSYLAKKALSEAAEIKNATNHLHARLIGIAHLVEAIKEIENLTKIHEPIAQGLVLNAEIGRLFEHHDVASFDKLVALLQTNTFKGKASFFSLSGRVLVAYKLMEEHKSQFAHAMLALGELDACLAIAKLMKKTKDQRVGYCFVDFVETETPHLKLDGFWNPFVNPEIVVTNDIELGGNQPQAVILTGSNTGGKSTILKAIMIDLLLARTFGIAAAQNATMSWFTRLGSSLNISDNTAMGDSLFQAEVKRAQNLVNIIDSLAKEFGFFIIDELFTGTAAEKGSAAAYRVAQHLAQAKNAVFILATHFPLLTQLEQETYGLFKNYKIEVYKDEQGNLVRPFKLEPGISTSNVADTILEQRLDFLASPTAAI